MLVKTIKYKDYDNKEITGIFHFNLTKMEVIEINLMDDLVEVSQSKDRKRIVPVLKRIARAAVGQKIGDRYVKSEEFADAFIASDAYSELFVEILGAEDPEKKMADFIKGIIPSDLPVNQDALPAVEAEKK